MILAPVNYSARGHSNAAGVVFETWVTLISRVRDRAAPYRGRG